MLINSENWGSYICLLLIICEANALLGLGKGNKKKKDEKNQTDTPWEGQQDHHNNYQNNSNGIPKDNQPPSLPHNVPPPPPPNQMIRYLLRDRKGQNWTEMPKDGSVPKKIWQEDGDLKMIFHGYSAMADMMEPIKVFKLQNVNDIGLVYAKENSSLNVIIVDWLSYAGGIHVPYDKMVSNVPIVGEQVADFILNLTKEENIKDLKRIHLIGFCSGAHVAGVVGQKILETKEVKLTRITGLDPSGVGWDDDTGEKYKCDNVSLTKEDAEFVDIIHCNMGKAGSRVQSGHIDFYPNGGEAQKECNDAQDTPETACSHTSCPTYFAKSNKQHYVACQCDDYDDYQKGSCDCTEDDGGVLMGDKTSPNAAGRYFLSIPKK